MGALVNRTERNLRQDDPALRYHAINSTTMVNNRPSQHNPRPYRPKKIESQIQIQLKNHAKTKNWIQQVYFTPESKFIIIFEIIQLILIYLYFIEIPMTLTFEKHRKEEDSQRIFQQINIPSITLFIVGIGIKLKTAFYRGGILICKQRDIVKNYLIYSFVFDFFSITSIIVYEFAQILNPQHTRSHLGYRFVVILFYLKLPEIVRIEKSLISSFQLNRRIKATIKLFLLLIKIFLICNIAACGMFYLSDTWCQYDPIKEYASCWIDSLKINGRTIRQSQWDLQYSYSLYWASTTMLSIGYGDVTPLNQHEVIYTIIVEFISCFVYAFSINEIWSIIQQKNNKKTKIHQRFNTMNVYMRDKNVSIELKSRVNAYLSYFYHTKNLREKQMENQIINQLTPSLRKQLFFESYGFIFAKHKFFNQFSSDFLEEASAMIQEIGYFQQQYVYQPQEQLEDYHLFYVHKGELQKQIVLKNNHTNNIIIEHIEIGQMIGLVQFVKQINYHCSMMASKYTLIYKIDHKNWKECLKQWDEDFQHFMVLKHKILYALNYKKLSLSCNLCGNKGHCTQNCLDKQIRSNKKIVIQKYMFEQQRKPYTRQKLRSNFSTGTYLSKSSKLIRFRKQSLNKSQKFIKKSLVHTKTHKEKMSVILEKKKMKESIWTDSDSSEEDILGETYFLIDKVQNFQIYFPNMNASLDISKDKKKVTIQEFLKI